MEREAKVVAASKKVVEDIRAEFRRMEGSQDSSARDLATKVNQASQDLIRQLQLTREKLNRRAR